MKVDLHDRLEAVDATAWDDLLARSRAPSPFLRWIWQDHWARSLGAERRREIRTVADCAGHLMGILSLFESAPGVWQIGGGEDVSDYLDLIVEAGLIRDAIARGKTRFDFLRGEEAYKYEFGPTPEAVYQVRIR